MMAANSEKSRVDIVCLKFAGLDNRLFVAVATKPAEIVKFYRETPFMLEEELVKMIAFVTVGKDFISKLVVDAQ